MFEPIHLNEWQQIPGCNSCQFLIMLAWSITANIIAITANIIFCCNAECITRIKWLCAPSFTGSCSPDIWRGWVSDLGAHRHPSVQFSKVRQWQGIRGNYFFFHTAGVRFINICMAVCFFIFILPSASQCCTFQTQYRSLSSCLYQREVFVYWSRISLPSNISSKRRFFYC